MDVSTTETTQDPTVSSIERVGVIGCGLMGSGIAEVCARAGLDVVVKEYDADAAERGLQRLDRLARHRGAARQARRGRP